MRERDELKVYTHVGVFVNVQHETMAVFQQSKHDGTDNLGQIPVE